MCLSGRGLVFQYGRDCRMIFMTTRPAPLIMKQILKLLFLGALLPACASRGIAGPQAMEWRERMMPIAPRGYVCGFVSEPVKFDGNLEAGAWASAPWTADFVDIQGPAKPTPRFHTRAKMLWDENYLYVAAELEEPHVWATQTKHDSVIFLDPDFEVFMDPDGDTANYYE